MSDAEVIVRPPRSSHEIRIFWLYQASDSYLSRSACIAKALAALLLNAFGRSPRLPPSLLEYLTLFGTLAVRNTFTTCTEAYIRAEAYTRTEAYSHRGLSSSSHTLTEMPHSSYCQNAPPFRQRLEDSPREYSCSCSDNQSCILS